jgi:hypothetical protein
MISPLTLDLNPGNTLSELEAGGDNPVCFVIVNLGEMGSERFSSRPVMYPLIADAATMAFHSN